jgi:integrase
MLNRHVNRYVQLHRSMGFKFRTQDLLLRNFVRFAQSKGDRVITTASAIEWASQAPSPPQRHNRLATLRRCALALHAEDVHHEVPPAEVFGREWFKRGVPHIYTPQQVATLIDAAGRLAPKNSIRPLTYATLFGLLAATGMRVSEALALTLDDLTEDGLLVRATKFKKSRLLPLHDSARAALHRYMAVRGRLGTPSPELFVSRAGTGVKYPTVIAIFLSLARGLGLRAGPAPRGAGPHGPRLHDLRHTFAVRSLEQCGGDRKAVTRHITALSTYLGHAHVSDTFWYLQATPVLMKQIAHAGEALHRGESV